jgi:2-dehydropantoate 2-reductase
MRHAVLGAGGVGGLLGAALTRFGADVVLLMRPESLARYPGELAVESRVLGDFTVPVRASACLDGGVDVLWVTTKAAGLSAASALAPPAQVAEATVIPLMNGVDHVALLRETYPKVVAGAMRVESARLGPGRISQTSPFIRVDLAGARLVADEVSAAGIDCRVDGDEVSLLWQKLVFLAPLALATTAAGRPLGDVRHDDLYQLSQQEAVAVAVASGARIDVESLVAIRSAALDSMRSSMQRDVEQGNAPELDAIAGPILRGGVRYGIATPATQSLADQVVARFEAARAQGRREPS